MSYTIEQELKALLTQDEFSRLLDHFQLSQGQALIQTNTYYDSPDQVLKKAKAALRLRNFSNRSEWTLKIQQGDHRSLELTQEQAYPQLPAPTSLTQEDLTDKEILYQVEALVGQDTFHFEAFLTLKTQRWQVVTPEGEYALDISHYGPFCDYELELECQDLREGQAAFSHLLAQYDIPFRPADKKISRALSALKGQ